MVGSVSLFYMARRPVRHLVVPCLYCCWPSFHLLLINTHTHTHCFVFIRNRVASRENKRAINWRPAPKYNTDITTNRFGLFLRPSTFTTIWWIMKNGMMAADRECAARLTIEFLFPFMIIIYLHFASYFFPLFFFKALKLRFVVAEIVVGKRARTESTKNRAFRQRQLWLYKRAGSLRPQPRCCLAAIEQAGKQAKKVPTGNQHPRQAGRRLDLLAEYETTRFNDVVSLDLHFVSTTTTRET